jgi:uncharacterized protein
MQAIFLEHQQELIALCKTYRIKTLYAFGSACTAEFGVSSDIDFLIAFQDLPLEDYADYYFALREQLQNLFGRHIDLVTENSLENPYFIASIDKTKVLLYAA